jgi:precorrin-6B methylase 2
MIGFYLLAALLAVFIAVMLLWLGRAILFMVPMLHGPVFVPSKLTDIKRMLDLAEIKKGERVIDIGSGDGAILIMAAQAGFPIEGCEINPWLVRRSRQLAERMDLTKLVSVRRESFWDINYEAYDVIFLYGTSYIMQRLEAKLRRELRPGARIISNYFEFPTWQPIAERGKIRVYRQE